uniref:Ryncolin-1-like isoform X2 n=1 Tax=Crassostrea virginica TaxID=6565 RepID=A0A8B8B7I3_CRAVI|nr:ryncolin-1-like isoform X2 [Crassostrea virginica]
MRRPRNMMWLTLLVVVQFCVSQINSAGHTPLPYVKDEVSSFLKQAPWKHMESSGTLSGGPMVLTLMSKYILNGGLVFSKKYPETSFRSCLDLLKKKPHRKNRDGVYTIYLSTGMKKLVYCDMTTDGGGWTVIQRRFDGSTDFQSKSWQNYAEGFGNPGQEYWIGNDAIHDLTKSGKAKLRIRLKRFNGEQGNITYSTFKVGSKSQKYVLTVGGFNGSLGMKDSFSYHNGMMFTTKDSDNDKSDGNCAAKYGNGWWFNACHYSNLNGVYHKKPKIIASGVIWYYWGNKTTLESLKSSTMKIRS